MHFEFFPGSFLSVTINKTATSSFATTKLQATLKVNNILFAEPLQKRISKGRLERLSHPHGLSETA